MEILKLTGLEICKKALIGVNILIEVPTINKAVEVKVGFRGAEIRKQNNYSVPKKLKYKIIDVERVGDEDSEWMSLKCQCQEDCLEDFFVVSETLFLDSELHIINDYT